MRAKEQPQLEKLAQWGYTQPYGTNQERGIRNFQRRHGLPQTGVLEKETLELIQARYCNVPDTMHQCRRHSAAYSASGCKWQKKTLRFKHVSYSQDIPKKDIEETFRLACDAWEDVCGIKFVQVGVNDPADINVGWERIDGLGGTLAYAYLPGNCGGSLAGTMRFDLGERWSPGPNSSLLQTATHELGHILGFYHSNLRDSIMWPYSTGGGDKISPDDAAGAVAYYGHPEDTDDPEAKELEFSLVSVTVDRLEGSGANNFFFIPEERIDSLKEEGYSKLLVSVETVGDADLDVYSRWGEIPEVYGELDDADEYDHGSWTPGGAESYEIDLHEETDALFFLVQSYSGASQYSLTVRPQ